MVFLKRWFLLVACLFFAANGYSQVTLDQYLLNSYCNDDQRELESFFREWEYESVPLNRDSLSTLSKTKQHVYRIFEAFYDPLSLGKYGDVKWGEKLYGGAKYIVVQNQLNYIISNRESLLDFEFYDQDQKVKSHVVIEKAAINNFHPWIKLSPKIVFESHAFSKVLEHFILADYACDGTAITKRKELDNQREGRIRFISDYLRIIPHHWGLVNGLYYVSHPYVRSIVFNKDLTQAIVYFRIGWEGGRALLQKQGDNWEMAKSKLTWTE